MKLPFALYKVEGTSMLPTLRPGARILTTRWGKIRPGDLVIFKKEAKTMVKKVEHCEGEWLTVVPENAQGIGSDHFGRIEQSQILGKVILAVSSA